MLKGIRTSRNQSGGQQRKLHSRAAGFRTALLRRATSRCRRQRQLRSRSDTMVRRWHRMSVANSSKSFKRFATDTSTKSSIDKSSRQINHNRPADRRPGAMTSSRHAYDIRPRSDKRGVRSNFRCAAIRSACGMASRTRSANAVGYAKVFQPIARSAVIPGFARPREAELSAFGKRG